jgi:uncharacterized integral membrane protein
MRTGQVLAGIRLSIHDAAAQLRRDAVTAAFITLTIALGVAASAGYPNA